MAFNIGQTLGDYRVIGIIGSGGMGTVYKVQHLISDRIEAIKVILPDLAQSSELADRFTREIRVQARLKHPNIALLHTAFRLENQLLMVMEYLEGTTLHHVLRQGRMETAASLEIVLQVLGALSYAHEEGVVHRDIKPGNIMLAKGGAVKLMDFGIARSERDQQLTQTGAALGSVYYMSPEQVQGTGVDHRSDLYSVGIMLYEMVTGEKPITGNSSWAVMNAHVTEAPRSPSTFNSGLPGYLCFAILKAIEKDPKARHQSASDFTDTLKIVRKRYTIQAGANANLETIAMAPPGSGQEHSPAQAVKSFEPPVAVKTPTPIPQMTPTPAGGSSSAGAKRFDSAQLDRVKQELAAYIGPMARIVVDRAARKAANWQQLYEALSAEIEAPKERAKFLATRPR